MSEAVFIRLQGRLTAFSNELRALGATPALANPLGNQTYKEYVSQFSKMDDMLKSIRHHLTWMASAVAIGTVFAIPSQTISTIADVEKQMAAMRQVNHDVNTSQEVLNKTTQDFIGIAEQYGHSVDEIIKAGTLWGRGYKDLNTVMKLTSLTAKLAVADNMDIGLANRAVESVIMSYQKQGQAVQFATHVVDSWTKIAHNAQSSATDLAEALSRTGAAAKAVVKTDVKHIIRQRAIDMNFVVFFIFLASVLIPQKSQKEDIDYPLYYTVFYRYGASIYYEIFVFINCQTGDCYLSCFLCCNIAVFINLCN
jgi:hypothetical protein